MKRILVTGASGFLGGRVVERCLHDQLAVRAMVHQPRSAVRLARLGVDLAWCDLLDADSVRSAVRGCDAVVHCAYGTGGSDAERTKVTVQGTDNLAAAAAAESVDRFVHISTIGVHSYSPPAQVTEDTPMKPSGDAYCDAKILAERRVRDWSAKGLPCVILRPGNIYGPFSAPWTGRPLADIGRSAVSLVDSGHHPANMLYVDNAVEAIRCALASPRAVGGVFFITDGDHRTWADLMGVYASWLGGKPLHSIASADLLRIERSLSDRRARIAKAVHELVYELALPIARGNCLLIAKSQSIGPIMKTLWQRMPSRIKTVVREHLVYNRRVQGADVSIPGLLPAKPDSPLLPGLGLLRVYAAKTLFPLDRARAILGYEPVLDWSEAMHRTRLWAAWARLIP